jgi:hypothetical protein
VYFVQFDVLGWHGHFDVFAIPDPERLSPAEARLKALSMNPPPEIRRLIPHGYRRFVSFQASHVLEAHYQLMLCRWHRLQ